MKTENLASIEVPMYINGQRCTGTELIEAIEPTHGAVGALLHAPSPEQVEAAVDAAAQAFKTWGKTPAHARSAILARIA